MEIQLNGEPFSCDDDTTLEQLTHQMGLYGQRIAIELNEETKPADQFSHIQLKPGDIVEVVQAIGGGQPDRLTIAGQDFSSRLLVGTGKYKDMAQTQAAIEMSGAEIVTVAIRRTNIGQNPDEPNLLDVISPDKYTILPNTAGCFTAKDALRTCRLARELLGGHKLVKLEVLGDEKTLFPDITATLESAEILINEGFDVMVYTNDDPIIAKRLEEMGCVAVMPLAAPIGSGLGIRNPYNILTIIENANVPIIVDAGVGTASDAAIGMELGCDGILMNTAIAHANDPVLMASSMKKAVQAGREAYLAGRMPRRRYASASSPLDGLI